MNRVILGTLVGIVISSFSSISVVAADSLGVTPSTTTTNTSINQITDPYEQCLAYVKLKQLDSIDCKTRTTGGQDSTGAINHPIQTIPSGDIPLSLADITKIKNPYEQCLAYVAFKKITGVDCKLKAKAIEETITQKNDGKLLNQSGSTQSGGVMPPRPPHPPVVTPPKTGTGSQNPGGDIKSLMGAIEKLSPADRLALVKIIQTYLQSKNIKIPTIPVVMEKKIVSKNTQNQQQVDIKSETNIQGTIVN